MLSQTIVPISYLVKATADDFWKRAGFVEPFPRSLLGAIAWAAPISVVQLPNLALHSVQQWAARIGAPVYSGSVDRPLRGCLLAYKGQGVIFVDGTDSETERRFTVAHELAHFLLDYEAPRRELLRTLGASIAEVLDGVRDATVEERVNAVLLHQNVGVHVHTMHRSQNGEFASGKTMHSESGADQLAFELLAPCDEVRRMLPSPPQGRSETVRSVFGLLRSQFDLPERPAARYAAELASNWVDASFREWLRGGS